MSFTGLLRDGLTWPASPAPVAGSARLRANLQTQRRRIGLLIDSLIGGGAERVTLNLAQAFTALGHEVHIFIVRNEIQHTIPDGIATHVLTGEQPAFTNKFFNRMAQAWQLRRAVRAVEQDGWAFDFFVSNAEDSDRISHLAGLPHVFIRYRNSMLGYFKSKLGRRTGIKRKWHEWRLARHFRAVYGARDIITVSDAMQRDIVEGVGVHPRSLHTIYNPFDFAFIRELASAYEPQIEGPYIIYLARFSNRKRQDLLLEAFARSAARHTHRLVLMGDAYTESEQHWLAQTEALIDRLGLAERVILPGFHANPFPWIRKAAVFAMSSDGEGLPTVLIESLILGTPVVSTDCPTGPAEILTGKLAPFLCPCGDAVALAACMDAALASYPEISEADLMRFDARHVARHYLHYCLQDREMSSGRDVRLLRRAAWWM